MFINKKALGDFISQRRHQAGVSQAFLAQKLGYRTPQYVSNWERGSSVPPLRKMLLLATTLGISVKDLISAITSATEDQLKSEFSGKSKSKKPKKRFSR
jgi:transcriptional regulator with XRE-family HTH domain